jgi:YesN/AraC family two-component response regulator
MKFINVFHDYIEPGWHVARAVLPCNLLLMVTRGHIVYIINDEEVHLQKGDMLYVPEGNIREAHSDPKGQQQMFSVHFSHLNQVGGVDLALVNSKAYDLIQPKSFDYTKQRFALMHQEWQKKLPDSEVYCLSLLIEIFTILNREVNAGQVSSRKLALVLQIQQYIFDHYREPLTMTELASHVHRSPNYINAIFREITDQTPIEYFHHLRIARAQELLADTQMTVREVSDYLGYCDQSYFNRVFRKLLGFSPSVLNKCKGKHIKIS